MKESLFVIISICCMWSYTTSQSILPPTNYTTQGGLIEITNPELDESESHLRKKRLVYGNQVWNNIVKIGYANYTDFYSRSEQDQALEQCTRVSTSLHPKFSFSINVRCYFSRFYALLPASS